MRDRSLQSKRVFLFLLAVVSSECGGIAIEHDELGSKPDAQPGTTADSGSGTTDASDASDASALDAEAPDANADVSVFPLSTIPWKQTRLPLCLGTGMRASAHSVWSDGKSIYVVAASPADASGHLFSNEGHGWVQAGAPFDGAFMGVTGFIMGPLIVSQQSASCGVDFLTDGTATCSAPIYSVDQVAVVNESLAYAVNDGGVGPSQVIRYNGAYWSDSGIGFDDGTLTNVANGSIWATSRLLVATSKSGALHVFKTADDGTAATPLAVDAPSGVYTALWGSSATDVWAGNQAGDLLHQAGASWSVVAHVEGCGGIKGIWGVGGTLYFITESAFGQWSNGVLTKLYEIPCGDFKFAAIWGNSVSEIFITLTNPDLDATVCGGSRAIWYNGSEVAAL